MEESESQYGIEGFVSECAGFSCVIKQRYQDFIVNEIDRFGRVVRLTDLDTLPDCDGPDKSVTDETASEKDGELWNANIDHQLAALVNGDRSESVRIPCPADMDKSARTRIHNSIRERFTFLESATSTDGDGLQTITVTKRRGDGRQSRKRTHWPHKNGDYVRFVLYKENMDSHFALSLISRPLGLKPHQISLAGTKDRRAVTSQLATAYRVEAEKLASLNGRLRGIKLGDFRYCPQELYLGDSSGNRFTIVMRNVTGAERNTIESDISKWKRRGFINYFGAQRFGTSSVPTHRVGKAILLKRWDEAVDLLLSPRDNAPEGLSECFRVWASTKDPSRAMAAVPGNRRRSLEGLLLTGLKKHGVKDFNNAFRFVPRNSRTLYVHSFQSLVWNKLVSKRVAKYGRKLLPGDDLLAAEMEAESEPAEKLERLSTIGTVIDIDNDDDGDNAEKPFRLRIPLPSAKAELANEEMLRWYEEILEEEGVTPDHFQRAEKEYALHGGFRRVFVQPADAEYRFYQYDDPTVPLARSDYDLLLRAAEKSPEPEAESGTEGAYLALRLDFTLPAGCYATMAVRELCRIDTGKHYQTRLNDYCADAGLSANIIDDDNAADNDCLMVQSSSSAD